jgi:hypothetical protein
MKKLIFMALVVILLLGIFPVSAAHHGAPPVSKILDITKGGTTSIDFREITVPDDTPLNTNESGGIDFDYYGDLLNYPQRIVLSTVNSDSTVSVEISSLNNYGFSTTINIVDSSCKVITGSDKFNWGSLSYYEGWTAIVPAGTHVEILVSPIINVVQTYDALTGNLKGIEATVRFADTINIATSTTIESVLPHNHHGRKDPPVTEIIGDPPTKVENTLTDTQMDNVLGNYIDSGNKLNNFGCYSCNNYRWYEGFIPAISIPPSITYNQYLRQYETAKNQLYHLNDIPTTPWGRAPSWSTTVAQNLTQFYGYSMGDPSNFRA